MKTIIFCTCLGAAALLAGPAFARSLDSINTRGTLSLCAHPNALPFASRKGGDLPGFQIELARALAERLGVGLSVQWITFGTQYRAADCDIVMDAIVEPAALEERHLRASVPYFRSGVALAVRHEGAAHDEISSFADLSPGRRVGVMVGSLAHMMLNKRGLRTIPFGFEDEMVVALATGEIDAAAVSPASIGYFNKTHPDQALRVIPADSVLPDLTWNVAVGLRQPDKAIRAEIDKAVAAMLDDGTVKAIYARYGVEHQAPGATN
jgi:polar amino acid transport system substrate-binding protein